MDRLREQAAISNAPIKPLLLRSKRPLQDPEASRMENGEQVHAHSALPNPDSEEPKEANAEANTPAPVASFLFAFEAYSPGDAGLLSNLAPEATSPEPVRPYCSFGMRQLSQPEVSATRFLADAADMKFTILFEALEPEPAAVAPCFPDLPRVLVHEANDQPVPTLDRSDEWDTEASGDSLLGKPIVRTRIPVLTPLLPAMTSAGISAASLRVHLRSEETKLDAPAAGPCIRGQRPIRRPAPDKYRVNAVIRPGPSHEMRLFEVSVKSSPQVPEAGIAAVWAKPVSTMIEPAPPTPVRLLPCKAPQEPRHDLLFFGLPSGTGAGTPVDAAVGTRPPILAIRVNPSPRAVSRGFEAASPFVPCRPESQAISKADLQARTREVPFVRPPHPQHKVKCSWGGGGLGLPADLLRPSRDGELVSFQVVRAVPTHLPFKLPSVRASVQRSPRKADYLPSTSSVPVSRTEMNK